MQLTEEDVLHSLKQLRDRLERTVAGTCQAQASLTQALGTSHVFKQALATVTLVTTQDLELVNKAIEALEADGMDAMPVVAACLNSCSRGALAQTVPVGVPVH